MATEHLKYMEKHKAEHYGTDRGYVIKAGQGTSGMVTFGQGPKRSEGAGQVNIGERELWAEGQQVQSSVLSVC